MAAQAAIPHRAHYNAPVAGKETRTENTEGQRRKAIVVLKNRFLRIPSVLFMPRTRTAAVVGAAA
jgi:hypothetical protein